MSAPDTNPSRRGGLTEQQDRRLIVLLMMPFVLAGVVAMWLFPDLPLEDPFTGALLTLIPAFYPFRTLDGPVAPRQLKRFVFVALLATTAIMLVMAVFLFAAVPADPYWLHIVVGFGGTFLITWSLNWRIFRIVIGAAGQAVGQHGSSR